MKRRQQGFTVIEMMFFILVVALLVDGAYYVGLKNKDNKAKSSAVSTDVTPKSTADEIASWQTYTGRSGQDAQNPAVQADQIAYTFKYPQGWKFLPIGTVMPGQDGSNSFQEIAPPGSDGNNNGLIFNGVSANKISAEQFFKNSAGDQSGLVGPTWQGVKSFTTSKGYSGYMAKLDSDRGADYEVYISNSNGKIVQFNYADRDSKYFDIYQKIFDSVSLD